MSPTTRRTKRFRWLAVGTLTLGLAACRPVPDHQVLQGEGGGHTTTTVAAAAPGTLTITVRLDGVPAAGIDGWAFPTDGDPQSAMDQSQRFTTNGAGQATIHPAVGPWAVQVHGEPIPDQDDPLCGRTVEDTAIVPVAGNGTTTVTLDLEVGPQYCSGELLASH